jgi:hypothetical protein
MAQQGVANMMGSGLIEAALGGIDQAQNSQGGGPFAGFGAAMGNAQPQMQLGSLAMGQPAGGFDPSFYMQQNPDVAQAVQAGDFSSPLQHYRQFGIGEGRNASAQAAANPGFQQIGSFQPQLPQNMFMPQAYMQQNPDVAQAVQAGDFASPLEQYQQFGMAEGRSPGPNLSGMLAGLGGMNRYGSGAGFGYGDPSRQASDYRQPFGETIRAQQMQKQIDDLMAQIEGLQGSQNYFPGGPNWGGGGPDGGPGGPGAGAGGAGF